MDKKIDVNGNVAIITGAGSGLGKSYALELARRGAKVIVNDLGGERMQEGKIIGGGRSNQPAQTVVDLIKSFGGEATSNCEDVSDPEGVERMFDIAQQKYGRVDILINNAAIAANLPVEETCPEYFQHVMEVNVLGAMLTTKKAWPMMLERGYGRIIYVSSPGGLWGSKGLLAYSAAKYSVLGLMRTLNLEREEKNIKINTIAPTAATPASAHLFDTENPQSIFRPEHVAAMVVYLASKECEVSGDLFFAAGGRYSRLTLMDNDGVQFDPRENITAENVMESMEKIMKLEGLKAVENANEHSKRWIADIVNIAGPEALKSLEKAMAYMNR